VATGFLSGTTESGHINDRLSVGVNDQLAIDWWPPHDSIGGDTLLGDAVRTFPVSVFARTAAAWIVPSMIDDWYDRIHVSPRSIALGNLASEQEVEVEVWNAYFVDKTLTAIDGIVPGVVLTGPATPDLMPALHANVYALSVASTGSPDVDIVLIFDFSDAPDKGLPVTGERIIAWTFAPSWDTAVRERLAWKTDRKRSQTGAEQRRGMRRAPRRQLAASAVLDRRERAFADNVIHAWGGRVFAVPVWHDVQRLVAPVAAGSFTIACTTDYRDFAAGGLALLRGDTAFDYEAVSVESVAVGTLTLVNPTQQEWPAGTRLYPARQGRFLTPPSIARKTDQAWTLDVEFRIVEPCDWPAAVFATTYRSHPVLAQRPDEGEGLAIAHRRLQALLDNQTGLQFDRDLAQASFMSQGHRTMMFGPLEHSEYRSLLYALDGMRVSVWVPTHAEDFVLVANVSSGALTLDVEATGYAAYGVGELGRRDIRIELTSGTVLHRRISSAEAVSTTVERLTIDSALGIAVTPAEVSRISFLRLMVLDSDEVEIVHETDIEGGAVSAVVFEAVRDDV
jgi:hypothetical protein